MLEVRNNYKAKYSKSAQNLQEKLSCPLCSEHLDNEENIFQCEKLGTKSDIQFEDLFSKNIDKVSKALKYFNKLWKIRLKKLEEK